MKKYLLFRFLTLLVFSFIASFVMAQTVYHVSPLGDDSNPGTETAPFKTIEKVCSVLRAGETGLIHAGTYTPVGSPNVTRPGCIAVETAGNEENRIKLWAAGDGEVIVDFSNVNTESVLNRGFYFGLNCKYWHLRGFEIRNAGDNGIKCEASFMIFENLKIHDNRDTGLQIGMFKDWNQTPKPAWWPSGEPVFNPGYQYCRNNIVINCDSYNNHDSDEGDADGFAAKLFPGPGTEYHGCRAWNNADDNWDLYMVYHPILIDNCWSWKAGHRPDGSTSSGNGNGFKLGGGGTSGGAAFAQSVGAHVVNNCISFNNSNKGFDQNNAYEGMYLVNCLGWNNLFNFRFATELKYGEMTLRNCIGFKPQKSAQNHEFEASQNPDVQFCSWITLDGCNLYKDKAKGSALTKDYTKQFKDLSEIQAAASRKANGELPDNDFARLVEGSVFIDTGIIIANFQPIPHLPKESWTLGYEALPNITIPYNGKTADMGAFEFGDPTMASLRNIGGLYNQTVFTGTAIENIVFRYGGAATGIIVANLPDGLTSVLNTNEKILTISGTPTASGTFSVKTEGGENVVEITGNIVVSLIDFARLTASLNTTQTVNIGSEIKPIVFTWGGGATDVICSGLPAGLIISKDFSSKTVTITGLPVVDGSFTVTTLGGLGSVNISATIIRVVPTRILTGDWYLIQDNYANIPSDLVGVVSFGSGASYPTRWDSAYTESAKPSNFSVGAVNLERGGYLMFNLPSLAEMKFNMLTTGSRSLEISYGTPGTSETTWTKTTIPSFSKGTFPSWDVMAMGAIKETKSPIGVKIFNPESNGGGIRIYDFLVKIYDEPASSRMYFDNKASFSYYQTETALIVNGEIAALKIHTLAGQMVSASRNSQFVNTAHLSKGIYIVGILGKNGASQSFKFLKH